MRVRHGECCVEIEFKACFRDFLRYSLYSSWGRDKLSEAGEFYLRGCKVTALLFCASVLVVSRVVLNSTRHSALWSHYAHRPAFAVHCRYRAAARVASALANAARFGNPCIALHVAGRRRLKFYVRRLTPHLAPPLEISCEVVCASFDAIARIRVLRVSRV